MHGMEKVHKCVALYSQMKNSDKKIFPDEEKMLFFVLIVMVSLTFLFPLLFTTVKFLKVLINGDFPMYKNHGKIFYHDNAMLCIFFYVFNI